MSVASFSLQSRSDLDEAALAVLPPRVAPVDSYSTMSGCRRGKWIRRYLQVTDVRHKAQSSACGHYLDHAMPLAKIGLSERMRWLTGFMLGLEKSRPISISSIAAQTVGL